MIKRIATGVSVGVVGLAVTLAFLLLAGFPLNRPLEEHNRRVVQEGLDLCQRSKCAKTEGCGYFNYTYPILDSGPEVNYTRSYCEENFLDHEADQRKRRDDQEIRKKYSSKD